ncbi:MULTISPECIES: hypothetical protein [unclassified Pigmentiphaga]|uniref:hypothetical protein n=1 Tax=unclassified Pigmentiphaga TaxID=2626614 RepID=UPI000B4129F3|nr:MULTISPECIES: hypothetical protein [unclassified Pigmentiphaga]OVZ65175.1 hypothetical protein CDO46_07205 [Pigmentiphaga sp. NML030171]
MTASSKALLTLWLHLDPVYEEALDAWYDYEHTDIVLGVPGVVGSRRFKSTKPYTPDQLRYLVFYEMADENVQLSAEFQAIVDAPTPWSRYLRTLYQMRRRTNYRCLCEVEKHPIESEAAILMIRSSVDSLQDYESGYDDLLRDSLEQPDARAAQIYQAVPNQFRIVNEDAAPPQTELLELYSFTHFDANRINDWIARRRMLIQQMSLPLNELSSDTFVPTIRPRRKRIGAMP